MEYKTIKVILFILSLLCLFNFNLYSLPNKWYYTFYDRIVDNEIPNDIMVQVFVYIKLVFVANDIGYFSILKDMRIDGKLANRNVYYYIFNYKFDMNKNFIVLYFTNEDRIIKLFYDQNNLISENMKIVFKLFNTGLLD